MVNFLLAVETSVSHRALTEVATFGVVDTTSAIEARSIRTGIGAQLTVVAIESRWTGALVAAVIILYWKECKQWLQRGLFPLIMFFINKPPLSHFSSHSVLTAQLPPLRQGFPEHSLTWISQLAPVYPGRQEQV